MQVEGKDLITWGAMGFTWLAGIFGIGSTYGKLLKQVTQNSADIEEIKKLFITHDNEPRLMSFTSHNAICEDRLKVVLVKLENIEKMVQGLRKER
jgi:hypothetical protein